MKQMMMVLPAQDFDPTEAAVTWAILKGRGIGVKFATPDRKPAVADLRMVTGEGLGLLASILRADENGRVAYARLLEDSNYLKPESWGEVNPTDYDGLILPGGHAPGMKPYLESKDLQNLVVSFADSSKVVGAICHGVVLAARSLRSSGESMLVGRKVTALLESQELLAWNLTRVWLKNYYRTYPETVEAEVRRSLSSEGSFVRGPLPLFRDSPSKLNRGFVVQDGNLITARWPGDAHLFGHTLADALKSEIATGEVEL